MKTSKHDDISGIAAHMSNMPTDGAENDNDDMASSSHSCGPRSCLEKRERVGLMYPAASAVLIGALSIGTVIGYPSMAISSMVADAQPMPGSTISHAMRDSDNVAWFNSLMALAALPGAFLAGLLSNSLGRRLTLITAAVPFALGWLLIAFATTTAQLFLGRILSGFGTGMTCVAGPVYIVDISSSEIRGLLGGLFGGIISAGILFCGVFGGLFLEWRSLAVLNAALPTLAAGILVFMPASPKLLVSKGRLDEAIEAINRLHGGRVDARLELLMMKGQSEHHRSLSLRDLLSKSTLKASGIAICLMLFQSFSGMNAVIMYTVPILRTSAPTVNPIYCTIMLQAVQVAVNMAASSVTNRFGRRSPLIFSALAMCFSLAGLGCCQYVGAERSGSLPVAFCLGAVIGYAIGFGPLPWLVVAEVAPTRVSGLVSALATSTNWASFFILIRTFDSLVNALSSHTVFWIYASWCFVAFLFSAFCLPETAHKSHHEIEMILEGKASSGGGDVECGGMHDIPKKLLHRIDRA